MIFIASAYTLYSLSPSALATSVQTSVGTGCRVSVISLDPAWKDEPGVGFSCFTDHSLKPWTGGKDNVFLYASLPPVRPVSPSVPLAQLEVDFHMPQAGPYTTEPPRHLAIFQFPICSVVSNQGVTMPCEKLRRSAGVPSTGVANLRQLQVLWTHNCDMANIGRSRGVPRGKAILLSHQNLPPPSTRFASRYCATAVPCTHVYMRIYACTHLR